VFRAGGYACSRAVTLDDRRLSCAQSFVGVRRDAVPLLARAARRAHRVGLKDGRCTSRHLVDHELDRAQRVVPLDELLKVEDVAEGAVRFAVSARSGRIARGASAASSGVGIRVAFSFLLDAPHTPTLAWTSLRNINFGVCEWGDGSSFPPALDNGKRRCLLWAP
jgi:hypothetical protein